MHYTQDQRLKLVKNAILNNEECLSDLEYYKHKWVCMNDIDKYRAISEIIEMHREAINEYDERIAPCNDEIATVYVYMLNDWRI